jgi:thioredoxin-related protein
MHNRLKDKGVVLLALTREKSGVVADFVKKSNINYIVGAEAEATVRSFGVRGYPTILVFDRQGRQVYRGHSQSEAEQAAERALG